jgi:ArsR family transcriptional regulator
VLDLAKAERMAALLKAVAHPIRLKLLSALRDGEANVTDLTARVGSPQAVVSGQLAILRMNGLVHARRERGFVWYRVDADRLGEVFRCFAEHAGGPQ